MKKASKAKPPNAEDLLAIHLGELGIKLVRQYKFYRARKWAADFVLWGIQPLIPGVNGPWLIEVDGFHNGRHGKGWGADYERDRMAQILGYRVLRFTTTEVLNGSCKAWILKHLLGGGK